MAATRIAQRRMHTGTFSGDQAQQLAQQAAARINQLQAQVTSLEALVNALVTFTGYTPP